MNALSNLWAKFSRSKKYRDAFVAAQLKRGIPTQIRILRKQRGWNQAELAKAAGLTQGAMSRAEDPDYGNLTFNNALKIASGLDVAFIGRFVPFSELAYWHINASEQALQVPSFTEDSIETGREVAVATVAAFNTAPTCSLNYDAGFAAYFNAKGIDPWSVNFDVADDASPFQAGNLHVGQESQVMFLNSDVAQVPKKIPHISLTSAGQFPLPPTTTANISDGPLAQAR